MKKTFKKSHKNNLKKYKEIRLILYVAICISFLFLFFGILLSYKEPQILPLNNLIINKKQDTYKNAYINIKFNPILFAEYANESNKYYIVQDGEYMYIAFLDDKLYKDIIKTDFQKDSFKIVGYTKQIPRDVKELAISTYNEMIGKELINEENIDSYFGNIYLDTSKTINIFNTFFGIFAIIFGISSFGLIKIRKQYLKK